jgi:hypothetical protein
MSKRGRRKRKDGTDQTALPFQTHSVTSQAAAQSAAKWFVGARYRVYEFIRDHPNVTDEEIAAGLAMNPNTARPRRIELAQQKFIATSGMRRTKAGVLACTYVVVPGVPDPNVPDPNMLSTANVLPPPTASTDESYQALLRAMNTTKTPPAK